MKQSHYTTPRTMSDATWHSWGQALHGFPEVTPRRDAWYGIALAVAIGATLACLVIWRL